MKKKLLSLILASAMAISAFAVPTLAAEVETIEIEDEEEETEEAADEETEAAGDYHIGIVTGSVSQSEDDRRGAEAFQEKYGEDRVTLAIYPDNVTEELETTIQTIVNLSDDPDMKASEKETLLGLFADIFRTPDLKEEAGSAFEGALPESWRKSDHPYMNLCLHTHVVVPLLKELPEVYAAPVRDVTIEMCGGMAKFALRQEAALSSGWFTLESVADLDEYCYYVAGIVGKLLTNLFAADTCLISDARKAEMQKLDVSFGLALQVANIVKDCVEDSTRRVCFVPEEICRRHGFAHSYEMFDVPAAGSDGASVEFRADFNARRAAVMGELVAKAWKHLDDAIAYTKLVPNVKMRTRLFCLWPLFMATVRASLPATGR